MNRSRASIVLTLLTLVTVTSAARGGGGGAPEEVLERLKALGLAGDVTASCRGTTTLPNGDFFAVALASSGGKGARRYLVLHREGSPSILSMYADDADLACYTPAEARELNDAIEQSATISGKIAPLFSSTVVCGFLDATHARCWQYSPSTRRFVVVGEWTT